MVKERYFRQVSEAIDHYQFQIIKEKGQNCVIICVGGS